MLEVDRERSRLEELVRLALEASVSGIAENKLAALEGVEFAETVAP